MKENNQKELVFKVDKKIDTVEEYKFEPIKGYPMLHWKGKRPFTATQYYPAQLKENHGEPINGWMNRIYWGDNLQVMSHLLKEFRAKIDLIYIDPPFDSNAEYKITIQKKGKAISNDQNSFEEKQYNDIWINDEYLQFMYSRFILLRELLNDKGSIYVHVDYHKAHYIRLILDEIFGGNNFVNEIIWRRGNNKMTENKFPVAHDNIFIYSKTDDYYFVPQFQPYSDEYISKYYGNIDSDGRRYQIQGMYGKGDGPALYFGDKLIAPPPGLHWRWNQGKIKEAMSQGIIVFPKEGKGMPRFKDYLDNKSGLPVRTIWDDLVEVNSQAIERLNYPTQKPESLLERIIKTSSKPGDLVFDCFMGSGTTQAAAFKLGRRFIGADINLGAIQITTKRLLSIAKDLNDNNINLFPTEKNLSIAAEANLNEEDSLIYSGFSVYNVNHYDIFRNPTQAKDILIQALEIQSLPGNTIYDGEKDGRLVKIMPINRIATKADLNELITAFNFKEFEKRQEKNPGKPIENLLLVCMGHEPDLAASLQSSVPYKLDIKVVDILRDKSNLEFKRDSEAEIEVKKGMLIIKHFFPMNLLQKLSLMKQDVREWRELVESVMVDFHYDGSVFEPTVVDVPEKSELVSGRYAVPYSCGTIRVKITDLLSESLEMEVPYAR